MPNDFWSWDRIVCFPKNVSFKFDPTIVESRNIPHFGSIFNRIQSKRKGNIIPISILFE